MAKKNVNKKLTIDYSSGDIVYIPDIGEMGKVIGRSYKKKDYYIVELDEGNIEFFTDKELEKTSPENEYNMGLYEGEKYGICIRNEIIADIKGFAEERSRDYAEGYLQAALAEMTNISDDINIVLDNEEE